MQQNCFYKIIIIRPNLVCSLYIKTIYSTHLTRLFFFSRTVINTIYPATSPCMTDSEKLSSLSSTSAASAFSCVR